jgi:hypothetical protein
MLRGKIKFALASAGFAALAIAIPSCASILGIEDLSADGGASSGSGGSSGGSASTGSGGSSSAGTAGSSAGGSNGGASGSSAGGSSGGSTGPSTSTTGSGGTSGGSGGNAGSATGGAAGTVDGGAGRGGSGGSSSGDAGITVHGTVIDYWRHRVPNVAVFLGSATAMTDANGQFTFTGVTPPYDVGLAVHVGLIQFGGSEDAYLFRGLTRTDPTLQVKDGLVGGSSTGNTWHFQNFPSGTAADGGMIPRYIGIAFGSPDTMWQYTWDSPDGTDLGASYFDFEGPASSVGTVHALLWETPTQDQVSPTRFVSYDQQPLTIDAVTAKTVTFNMMADSTPGDVIAGSVTSAMAGPIEVDGYVRFDDGAPIHVVQLPNAGQNFQMLMPKITGSSISVTALVGSTPSGPFALAHLDGLTPGQGGVAMTIPAPVTLVSPPGGTSNVGPSAMFQWSASPHVALFYLYCPGPGTDDGPTRFFVVTEDYKTQLPVFSGTSAIAWPKARSCYWSVEVHGAYGTVDQAADPTGFFDSHGYFYYGELNGLKRDNGSFTVSDSAGLTTAP